MNVELSIPDVINLLKRKIDETLYAQFEGVVQTGPFKGMHLPREYSWDGVGLGAELLGCYEQELHQIFEAEIKRLCGLNHPKIVNLGCAEGYYAVGLARAVPNGSVWIYDVSDQAIDITMKSAKDNGVAVIDVREIDHVMHSADFVVSDCEGGELTYLDPVKYDLTSTSIIVECHAVDDKSVTQPLIDRFRDTHNVYLCYEGGRNPNEFECLCNASSLFRWLAVTEGRPCRMHWLYIVPKDVQT